MPPAGKAAAMTIHAFGYFVLRGGLASYGPDTIDIFRRSAIYVDRILKGAKSSELPVQAPTKYELVLNLKTAKALGNLEGRENDISQAKQNRASLRIFASLTVI